MQMSDASHAEQPSQIDVAGYRACRNEWCTNIELVEVTYRTNGLCFDCFRGDLGSQIAEVEVRNNARVMSMKAATHNSRRSANTSKGNRATKAAAMKAAKAADRRLRALFPELYEVLRAEERARFGLEPFPVDNILREAEGDVSETISFARVYDALDEQGVDVDGLEDPPAR